MNINQFIQHTLTLAIGGSIVALVVHYLFKSDTSQLSDAQLKPQKEDDGRHLLSLRLHAHERMVVYVERINPINLLPRLYVQGIEVKALQILAVNEIKNEYQHNVTQQLYVDAATWEVLRKLKDDTIAMINNAVEVLPGDVSGVELSKKVLYHMSQINENPYELTIGLIKKQIHQLF